MHSRLTVKYQCNCANSTSVVIWNVDVWNDIMERTWDSWSKANISSTCHRIHESRSPLSFSVGNIREMHSNGCQQQTNIIWTLVFVWESSIKFSKYLRKVRKACHLTRLISWPLLSQEETSQAKMNKSFQQTKSKKLVSPRIELGTSSVLDWRDNQLHHETLLIFLDQGTCLRTEILGFLDGALERQTTSYYLHGVFNWNWLCKFVLHLSPRNRWNLLWYSGWSIGMVHNSIWILRPGQRLLLGCC